MSAASSRNTSTAVFWLVCIPVRTGLAALAFDLKDAQAKKVLTDERNNPRVQKKAALVGFGAAFAASQIAYSTGYATRNKGVETGNKPIWWKTMRPVHALLWSSFVVLSLLPRSDAGPGNDYHDRLSKERARKRTRIWPRMSLGA